jgi:hypothetical protein
MTQLPTLEALFLELTAVTAPEKEYVAP